MKKLLFCLTSILLLTTSLAGAAGAQPPALGSPSAPAAGTQATLVQPAWAVLGDPVSPTVSAIDPMTAPNDIDTAVTLTGSGFAAVMDDAGTVVVTSPTATLGTTALTDVTWVDSTTLTATVPWGMDSGTYPLKVVNPDGGTGSLPGAFTVTQGLGRWNGGGLFGGQVDQLLMKPGDPNTLYAPAYGVHGLFRSQDAGEHWAYVNGDVIINNGRFAIDPLHAGWLYCFGYTYQGIENGLLRSKDGGVTWTQVMPNTWPDKRVIDQGQAYVSPHDPQVLFVGSSTDPGNPYAGGATGLIKSTDGGATWHIVADMKDISVRDVAFDPTSGSSKMVLATSDGRVFQSTNGGSAWSEVSKPPLSDLGFGWIVYNPDKTSEVWVSSTATGGGVYKSTAPSFTSWQDVSSYPGLGTQVTFTGADSVYTWAGHSVDGGTTWQPWGPWPWYSTFSPVVFDPSDPLHQTVYTGDGLYGVHKTTNGGTTWAVKNQGLTGMVCTSMDVSRADPLRVYAAFGSGLGIHRSDDGTSTWTYLPIAGASYVSQVREDPFDPQRVYVAAGSGFYVSTDKGESWSAQGWHLYPASPAGDLNTLAPDPFKAGHLLGGSPCGLWNTGTGLLYSSSDSGASWQQVTLPQVVGMIKDIAFDPQTPGTVYVATWRTGIYKSTDSGATWTRIDDRDQADMGWAGSIAIATHPQHVLLVAASHGARRSLDGGATWTKVQGLPGENYMFADGDSTRLYAAGGFGLGFSSNAGDSWTQAAGMLGRVQILALGYGTQGDHTIIYAATPGGNAGAGGTAVASAAAASERRATAASTLVGAGIYRNVQMWPKLTLKLSGLSSGALRLGRRVMAKGVVTPSRLAGSKVKVGVQRKRVHHWITVKTVLRTIRVSGAYGWTYRPARGGVYRLRVTIAKTVAHAAARTTWRTFKVK